jgi:hypothetical protein
MREIILKKNTPLCETSRGTHPAKPSFKRTKTEPGMPNSRSVLALWARCAPVRVSFSGMRAAWRPPHPRWGGESKIAASTLGIISLPSGDVLASRLGLHPVGLRHELARLESGHPDALAPKTTSGGHACFVVPPGVEPVCAFGFASLAFDVNLWAHFSATLHSPAQKIGSQGQKSLIPFVYHIF